jgi:hypothetical protein
MSRLVGAIWKTWHLGADSRAGFHSVADLVVPQVLTRHQVWFRVSGAGGAGGGSAHSQRSRRVGPAIQFESEIRPG